MKPVSSRGDMAHCPPVCLCVFSRAGIYCDRCHSKVRKLSRMRPCQCPEFDHGKDSKLVLRCPHWLVGTVALKPDVLDTSFACLRFCHNWFLASPHSVMLPSAGCPLVICLHVCACFRVHAFVCSCMCVSNRWRSDLGHEFTTPISGSTSLHVSTHTHTHTHT